MENGWFVLAPVEGGEWWTVEVYDSKGTMMGEVTCSNLEDALNGIREAVNEGPIDPTFEEN